MICDKPIENIFYVLPFKIRQALYNLSPSVQVNISEIRLRKNLPVALTVSGETAFLKSNGQTCFGFAPDLLKTDETDISECFVKLCDNSVFAHENELSEGFIIMKNGCRAGICGNLCGGVIKDITSLNLRISREIKGCANKILSCFEYGGLLIAGPPASGKTTVLRDLIFQLSSGTFSKIKRCCVIDTRGEISGGGTLDLGLATDILNCENKAKGVEIALRTMFPDYIAFDEIGNTQELNAVSQSFCGGVKIITTAHTDTLYELKSREITKRLLKSGAINQVAILPKTVGDEIKVISVKEFLSNHAV